MGPTGHKHSVSVYKSGINLVIVIGYSYVYVYILYVYMKHFFFFLDLFQVIIGTNL